MCGLCMAQIKVKSTSGKTLEFEAVPGQSLMEALRDNGVDELMAICGGMMSCSTCHVYLLDDSMSKVDVQSDDEKGLLEVSSHLKDNSRLSCQIQITSELDSLHVEVAPED